MKVLPLLLAALGWSWIARAGDVPQIPVEDFARTPQVREMRLSPDGEAVAFLADFTGRSFVCVKEFSSGEVVRFVLGEAPAFGTVVRKDASDFEWINERRLMITTSVWGSTYGVLALDREGGKRVGLTGYELDPLGQFVVAAIDVIHTFDDAEASVLMLDRRKTSGAQTLFPNVIKVNTTDGGFATVLKNPGNVVAWQADHEGVVRVGIVRDGENSGIIYRDSADSEWRNLPLPQRGHEKLRALGFDPIDGKFYVAGFNETDRWAVFPYDLATGRLGEALLSDPDYDVVGGGRRMNIGGTTLGGMVFSRQQQKLVGIWYVTDAPRVRWFDESYIGYQRAIDRALPDTINVTVDQSRDDRLMLVFAFSDRDPGRYFIVDREKHSMKQIGAVCPWINPKDMAPMLAVKLEARDGLKLHGYLTLPAGRQPENLPVVVMPHGGPWVRDVWGFDPLVQLLANRGYAVLQVNYRGSPGYGSEFGMKGRREIGRGIQGDIEDTARWALRTGLANPDRLAILGGSYGGFSALFALGRTPDLYRCGISINGVTDWLADWLAIFGARQNDGEFRFAREKWIREIGDPEEDDEFLRSISPVNMADAFRAPALIIQAREDRTVPPRQARDMVAALKRARKTVSEYFVPGVGHTLEGEKARTEVFRRVVEFLDAQMAATPAQAAR